MADTWTARPQRTIPSRAPHPRSPAARETDWSSVGTPHPDSPAGPLFDWSSLGVPHAGSPAARDFHRDGGSNAQTSRATVTANLSNVEKLKLAIERSLPKLPGNVRDKVKAMLTPQALATLVALAAAWGASQWIGIGEVVDVIMIGWGIWTFGSDAVDAGKDLYRFVTVATSARNDKDINQAADYFAHAITVIGVDGLAVMVAHGTFKAARSVRKSGFATETPEPPRATPSDKPQTKSSSVNEGSPAPASPTDPRVRKDLDSKWIDNSGDVKWPPNNGVTGAELPGTLTPGTTIGRYGSEKGSFASQPGASYQSLSLPYDPGLMPYREYEVIKPLDYSGGDIAPWFDQPGGATQYRFSQSVQSLIDEGFLRPLK